ncbi:MULTISPECIES: UDP-N-acetylmuramoyl-tripeptide--D-alanyl-D-alanine ligase [Prochlorococcus]|uniref:UDP-N-acetylmuramoyl-tripeptide--D-alanyl-D-alanine ligase n=1 Tax=Prochlorococcus marinus (strain SARG / CCMP1375 / SS120) TaxID=167539 RepID=Q7VBP1_PROMA|nr:MULTISPECIES: UDP-N-acetylmuramoyl-tripeptide--D-alanyl-D-alanine ligase [Prochlorococcus]AAQ00096.1 UDP-N-acetylmuramyl pentapeptide synthase [Prochlorococcus marinus subsp. marinus str. CCMP1375]KGG13892.1 UDP-N-acetylmuramoylalanyl-D-glutamyl-2,6- diaminopimelate--D-alanyl-D-alanine ligase [Prochlorococcus marinus str. LG]KGG19025.1 UDP-N-acetylmuramoylalanyl-D-glutamyl-2,6- diaminopimelate--D-alanyl-D-alanine ligase [Prochlorococcus marinus str. SS2]KGG23435.1 UDP-N-acetylmuramoylalanyl-
MVLRLLNLNDIWGPPYQNKLVNLDAPLGTVCTDSRNIKKGNFFVPLIGNKFDGHLFLEEVFEKGVQAAFISKDCNLAIPEELLYWQVDDTQEAYQKLAFLHRRLFSIPVVAVTGSAGKTTTRELIHSSLVPLGEVLATSNNNNNDIGVPFTLLKANVNHSAIVLEMAMRGLGQIERLSKCACPDIAVITNIGSSHIGLLGSKQNIASAKCEIAAHMNPNGFVIIPAGDQLLEKTLQEVWKGRIVRVDIESKSNPFFANEYDSHQTKKNVDYLGVLDSDNWQITYDGIIFQMPLQGRHNAINFMFALAVAYELNVPLDSIRNLSVNLPPGRNHSLTFGNINVLDETYNASPESVIASLDLLATKPGRHFAVLGNMYELGEKTIDYHEQIVQHSIATGLTGLVICVNGPEAEAMLLAGQPLSYIEVVSTPEDAFLILKSWLNSGDYLLLKASRKVSLERILPLLKEAY